MFQNSFWDKDVSQYNHGTLFLIDGSIFNKKNQSPISFGRSSIPIDPEIDSRLDLGFILDGYGFIIGHDPSSAYG